MISAARRAWNDWRKTSAADRAKILQAAVSLLAARRHELAALIVCEAGKPWDEAHADVAEAIDYLRFYTREAERLERGVRLQPEIPGEINTASFRPRGIAAVISLWNFPPAILEATSPQAKTAQDEIFGPLVAGPPRQNARRRPQNRQRHALRPDRRIFFQAPGSHRTRAA